MASETRSSHVGELQSIRGLAALAVVIFHGISVYKAPSYYEFLYSLLNGNACVVVFFVLSGYVLSISLASRLTELNWRVIVEFYVRRVFRLYPALWVGTFSGACYFLFFRSAAPDRFYTAAMIENANPHLSVLTVLGAVIGVIPTLDPPSWSILVELVGSFFMPIFFLLAQRRRWAFACCAIFLLCISITGRHTGVLLYLIDFCAGVALFFIPVSARARWEDQKSIRGLVMLASLFLLMAGLDLFAMGLPYRYMHLTETFAAFLLIGSVVHGKANIPILRNSRTVWIGDISYSLYIMHFPILMILAKLFALAGLDRYAGANPIAMNLLLGTVTVALTVPVAAWLFANVERKFIGLGGAVIRRIKATDEIDSFSIRNVVMDAPLGGVEEKSKATTR